jgi:nitroreductase
MSGVPVDVDNRVLREAVGLAVRAPSIHNTQPWRFRLADGRIELYADRSRQLTIVDPGGRALLVSCGGALLLARIALQNAGFTVSTQHIPDPENRDHLATLTITGTSEPTEQTAAMVAAAARRRTDRRPFTKQPLDEQTVAELDTAAVAEGAILQQVTGRGDRLDLIVAVGRADEIEAADPQYQAEMRHWSGRPAGAVDGVPVTAVPHLEGRRSDVELRDFEVATPGTLPASASDQVERAAMFLLATDGDGPADRLRAGEALTHVLLTATRLGLSVSPYTQPLEIPGTMGLLHRILGGYGQPQIVLRVGWPVPGEPLPPTGRRPVDEVIDQSR